MPKLNKKTKDNILLAIITIILIAVIIIVCWYAITTPLPESLQEEQYTGVISDKWITQRNGYDFHYFEINDYYIMSVNHIKYRQYEMGDNITFTMNQVDVK